SNGSSTTFRSLRAGRPTKSSAPARRRRNEPGGRTSGGEGAGQREEGALAHQALRRDQAALGGGRDRHLRGAVGARGRRDRRLEDRRRRRRRPREAGTEAPL